MEKLNRLLEHFGMPVTNIPIAAQMIAEGDGAIRYLEGVSDGANAVIELTKLEQY